MQLRDPLALLALIPVLALTVWAVRHTAAGHARWRLALGTALRVVLLLCLAAVLADLRLVRPNDERAVVFVVDASESVRPAARQHLLEWTRQAWVAHRPGDLAGLVVLGREARVEAPLAPTYAPADPSLEGWPRDRTALDRGLRLAGDLVRQHPGERRVVLLSDGNGDGESAAREAMALASAGIRLDTVAVELTPSPGEVLVGDVSAPPRATLGEPFLMKVELLARSGGPATLHVVRNGRYLEPRPLELAPGLNVVTLPQRLDTADVHVYQVSVEAAGDGNPANNAGGAVVRVRGRPRVLAVFGPDLDADGRRSAAPRRSGRPSATR